MSRSDRVANGQAFLVEIKGTICTYVMHAMRGAKYGGCYIPT